MENKELTKYVKNMRQSLVNLADTIKAAITELTGPKINFLLDQGENISTDFRELVWEIRATINNNVAKKKEFLRFAESLIERMDNVINTGCSEPKKVSEICEDYLNVIHIGDYSNEVIKEKLMKFQELLVTDCPQQGSIN